MPNLETNVIKSNLQSFPYGVKIFLAASKESGKSTWDIFFFDYHKLFAPLNLI